MNWRQAGTALLRGEMVTLCAPVMGPGSPDHGVLYLSHRDTDSPVLCCTHQYTSRYRRHGAPTVVTGYCVSWYELNAQHWRIFTPDK